MKKLISTFLALILTLSICACSFAESNTVTFSELKVQAPESVSFTIGGEVYDAPVILPEAEEIPLLVCKHQTFDTANLWETYPFTAAKDRISLVANAFYNYDGSPAVSYFVGTAREMSGKTDVSARYALARGETPPEIDLSPDDLARLVLDRMVEFGGDPATDLRVWQEVAWSGRCYTKWVKYTSPDGKVSFRMPAADPQKPVKGSSRGAWQVQFAQYVNGVPIFPYSYWPTADSHHGGDAPLMRMTYDMLQFTSSIYYVDDSIMSMWGGVAEIMDTLLADTPLVPFQTILNGIQKRIDEEQLQSVFRIELGYTLVPVKGDHYFDVEHYSDRPNTDARYVLLPTWNVAGYDLKDRICREGYGYTAPTRDEAYQAYCVNASAFELRFDAQTGELVQQQEFDLEGFAK